jgi:hypothetical protein
VLLDILISMMFVLGAFAIIPAQAAGPATVNLGTAGDFVVLAKTGISTTGTTYITGDIGVSPIDSTAITGFGLILDSTTTFSKSSLVSGKIYAADYAEPTPGKMTTAVSNMETAYTDAAGRPAGYTELYAGDITGQTLTPGCYKWGTGLLISAGGVTISGAASDVWIFQIAQDLTVADSAIVTLIGGAQASNIFWQVAGQTTIGTTVAMKGIILCKTLIEINTGATLVGRALAQTAVTLDANSISVVLDTQAPTVGSTLPVNTATGVTINSAMTATFSEAMDPSTITTTTYTLNQGITPVSGLVTYAGITATFTPTANLVSSTAYTATITTGAKDIKGNPLTSNYVWGFTTGTASDTTAPTVSSNVPANAATGVAINSAMTATFSEAMQPTTITTLTFTLKQGTTPVSGTVTYSGVKATFTPSANLASSTAYTATITTATKDLAGNAVTSNYVWTFTTGGVLDTTAPTVSSTVPANAATSVAINSAMTATFSEAMTPLTITAATFTLKQGTTAVSGAVSYTGTTATFTHATNLVPSTAYTATITTGAKDLAGNPLTSNYVWGFTTAAVLDSTAPTVSSTVPVNAATGVSINSAMTATFSEGMDPLTITTMAFTLKQGVTAVSGTVTYVGLRATFRPAVNLAPNTVYTATVTTGAKDLAGNAIATNFAWSFTTSTVTNPSTVGVVVGRIVDANGNAIEGANVSVVGTDLFNITSASGGYTLTEVPGGAQKLNISIAGYQDQIYDVEVAPDAATTNPDIVLEKDISSMNWAWLLLLAVALLLLLIIAVAIYSRRKKSPGAN